MVELVATLVPMPKIGREEGRFALPVAGAASAAPGPAARSAATAARTSSIEVAPTSLTNRSWSDALATVGWTGGLDDVLVPSGAGDGERRAAASLPPVPAPSAPRAAAAAASAASF